MAERATVAQVVRIADEAVSGTPETTGFKASQTVGWSLSPQLETRTTRPAGNKYATIATLGKDWTQLAISGEPSYEDLEPLFLSVIGNVTNTTKNHTFKLLVASADVVKTLTVQKGETGVKWEEVAGVQVNELQLQFNRDAVQVSGSALGKSTTFNGATAMGTMTTPGLHPIFPQDVCVYFDPLFANIGTTKLTRVLSATWQVSSRFNALWVLDCAEDSYVALVEATPEITVELTLEADTVGTGFVTSYARTGAKGFVEIEADGGTVDGDLQKLTIDTSVAVSSVGELGDQDGVYAYTVTMTGIVQNMTGATPGVCEISLDNSSTGAW